MLNFILFVLASFGWTFISVYGTIFDKVRPKWKLFHCVQCTGFWVGILVFVIFWASEIKLFPNLYFGAPIFGFISSGTSWILSVIFDDDGIQVHCSKDKVHENQLPTTKTLLKG